MRAKKRTFLSIFSLVVLGAAILGLFFFSSGVAAQASVNPVSYGSGYSAVLYDNTNGLPTSDANAIAQTKDGFIWIGSYSGLIRFDGNEFYRYDASFGVASVVSLFVDSKERLWIGTNDSGAFVLENEKFIAYDNTDKFNSLSIRSITEDKEGNVFLATTLGVAYVDKNGELFDLDDPRVNRDYVSELLTAENGVVYGITDKGAVFTVKNCAVADYYATPLSDKTVKTMLPDAAHEGYFYFGTDDAAVVYGTLTGDEASFPVYSVAPRRNVRSLKFIGQDLWVCSDDGVGFLTDGVYTALDALPMNNSVEKMFVDFEGNLWFTSSRQGLMKIVQNRFDRLISLAPRVVNSVYKQGGLYYIGTDNGLLILNEDREEVHNDLTEFIGTARIRSVLKGSGGKIYLGTGSLGLVRYDPSNGEIVSFDKDDGLAHNHARVMKEMSDGKIAVATKGGISVIENDVVTKTYDQKNGLNNLEILCLEEGPNGEIYAGSDGDGIYVIQSGNVSRIGRKDGLMSDVILRIKKDPTEKDLYWIITSNSIAYIRRDSITTITNFPYANNFDLYFDNSNRVWVLSSNGIYVAQKAALLLNRKIDYVFYDTSDGLPSAATANSYSCLDEDGTLYIASSAIGSTNLNADYEFENQTRLSIPYVLADGKYLSIKNGRVTVPASCKKLQICAYAFTYSLHNPRVAYKLEGFDDAETSVTRRELTPAAYTNLPGGSYKFSFSLVDAMNGKKLETITLIVVKERKVVEQVWFWILVALLGAAAVATVVILIFRAKTKKLLLKQQRDKELIDEMTRAFASCIDMKDGYTNGHSYRVAKYTSMMAKKMGMSEEDVEKCYHIALLHDIGKISIPDNILNKPGKLTDEEFAIMKSHSRRGYDILKEVKIIPDLALGAGFHHERQDGRGYPQGLKRDEIPLVAQIIAVADCFDAMYSTRPYRKSLSLEDVAAELKRSSGTQLNENIVNVFLSIIAENPEAFAPEGKEGGEDKKEE